MNEREKKYRIPSDNAILDIHIVFVVENALTDNFCFPPLTQVCVVITFFGGER